MNGGSTGKTNICILLDIVLGTIGYLVEAPTREFSFRSLALSRRSMAVVTRVCLNAEVCRIPVELSDRVTDKEER